MKRETIGVVKAHYHSGKIETVLAGGSAQQVLESYSNALIATLPPLAEGSFYAYHAERMASHHEPNVWTPPES